jgi:hypothetical protein
MMVDTRLFLSHPVRLQSRFTKHVTTACLLPAGTLMTNLPPNRLTSGFVVMPMCGARTVLAYTSARSRHRAERRGFASISFEIRVTRHEAADEYSGCGIFLGNCSSRYHPLQAVATTFREGTVLSARRLAARTCERPRISPMSRRTTMSNWYGGAGSRYRPVKSARSLGAPGSSQAFAGSSPGRPFSRSCACPGRGTATALKHRSQRSRPATCPRGRIICRVRALQASDWTRPPRQRRGRRHGDASRVGPGHAHSASLQHAAGRHGAGWSDA